MPVDHHVAREQENEPASFQLGLISERGAARWPHALALVEGERQLSFLELERAVVRFASKLLAAGVQPGDKVAVLGSKNLETVIVILAVSRAGAAYVAVDANLPDKRRDFVLTDSGAMLVVGLAVQAPLARSLPFLASSGCWQHVESTAPELPRVRETDLAYMIYTSGSTGYPKGVLIEHHSVEAFFLAHNVHAGIAAGDRCLNTGPFHFDVSILDVFLPLYFGASVVLTPELPMPKLLLLTIEQHRITHLYAVSTVLALITGNGRWLDAYDLGSLRLLQTGAEVCNPRVVNAWLTRLPGLRFLNSYGPTELTVGCTCYAKPELGPLPEEDVSIGTLLDGLDALLLDGCGQPVVGSEGELAVAGAQVMRGYHNRPEEEQKSLVRIDGRRYYRTGDLVRRTHDGRYHYLGRRDQEVKIDGHRVHLSELKRCLEAHPRVLSAVVFVVRTPRGRKRVAAALVPRERMTPDAARAVLAELSHELPTPFVPSALLVCEELSRSATGKADPERAMRTLERRLASSSGGEKIFFDSMPERTTEHPQALALAE